MTITYLKKANKTSSTDDNKTREIVENILKDIEKKKEQKDIKTSSEEKKKDDSESSIDEKPFVLETQEEEIPTQEEPDTSKLKAYHPKADDGYGANESDLASARAADTSTKPYVAPNFNAEDPSTWGRTPRNAPCPCGSGKKFKHCHGQSN